jgi:hypothetical protein
LRDLLDQNIGADESKNRDVKVKIVQSNTDLCQILLNFFNSKTLFELKKGRNQLA